MYCIDCSPKRGWVYVIESKSSLRSGLAWQIGKTVGDSPWVGSDPCNLTNVGRKKRKKERKRERKREREKESKSGQQPCGKTEGDVEIR
jgi:hypothetical protein